jgi:hypothetical protein
MRITLSIALLDGEYAVAQCDHQDTFLSSIDGCEEKLSVGTLKVQAFGMAERLINRLALLAAEDCEGRTKGELEAIWDEPGWPDDCSADNVVARLRGNEETASEEVEKLEPTEWFLRMVEEEAP